MKKVLVLNYEFPPLGGGASPVSYEIAERLSETGDFDIDVVTMKYKDLPSYEEVNDHFRIHRVFCLRSKKEICYPWEQLTYLVTGYLKVRSLAKKNKYSTCHCHFIIPTGVLALLLKKFFAIPYIITSHGSDVPGFNTDRFTILHAFTGPLLRLVCRNARKVVTPSMYLKSLILRNISPDTESTIVTIPNGIDAQKFIPQEKKKYIFSSGRLLPRKGFQYLIQAVSVEDIGYEVHIAGDGPMKEELSRLASLSKTKVVLHGWLDNRGDIYKNLLEQAAIYVLASEKENASIALLEAMSAGCGMITTNVSGCPETVATSGVLVEPNDVQDIGHAIKSFTDDPVHLNRFQSLARKRVEEVFDWNHILADYIEIL